MATDNHDDQANRQSHQFLANVEMYAAHFATPTLP